MSPQGITRKRPAPGTSPVVNPQLGPISNYSSNNGSQLSNDQFLQWGQNPAASAAVNPSSFPDPNAYNTAAYSTNAQDGPATTATASGQLARRQPGNQLISRNRGYEQPPAPVVEQGGSGEGGWTESLEELYQRAAVAKRESQAKRKQIPPFVQKLSSFLDESKNTELIRWSDDGNSFIVLDEDEFAKTLIPELFKHNNYASFVRQLNMYGFHKKVGLSDNSMRASERKNKSPSEYANPYFKRGHPDLLWLIQKPKNAVGQGSKGGKGNAVRVKTEDIDDEGDEYGEDSSNAPRDDRGRARSQLSLITGGSVVPNDQLSGVYRELQAIRQQQQIISNTITKLRREHEQLYAQAANFQEQHTRHENSINAILTFLATVYNRSLQGQEGPQNLANSFAGVISQDQGNVVDVGDEYSLLGSLNSPAAQRSMKKQPLLLKAPPAPDSRASTVSPAMNAYDAPPRKHARQASASQPGHVEEVFDNSPRQKNVPPPPPPQNQEYPSQRDIMSVIQNSNAQNGLATSFADFPNVLSSLETSGGNVPLTPNQRADMLRLMANETNTADPNTSSSNNNALITPTPPPMPQNYSGRLANTRQEIDNLVKMQAEQDRSVQNLTNLLQPLSPTGNIPGVGHDNGNVPPPPLDLDQIFSNDYFTDLGELEENKANLAFGDSTNAAPGTGSHDQGINNADDMKDANDLFDFDHIPTDGDLFDGTNQQTPGYFNNFDGAGYGTSTVNPNLGSEAKTPVKNNNNNLDSGRIVETLTDSETTSPSNTVDDIPQYGGSVAGDSQGGKGTGGGVKRRKKA
ncbi:hypothetical protein ASPWEDRAFT_29899 [Aspergillus wentii DTO 134E9]|uniref:HSF-type DNA-binding domain-containing protein n=1 Tax=Aspergillus wentii DTO 134E9 TaxID=1073089 RepID=A0A1L9RCW1_ASPWE|nr:uncharacterized protein ASPWEDRAFT_29899 [Aspergillus wentii DTO 134E9]KAI9924331.1 stress-responsive transcription factor hsf1 [Aspergillus wentii]OJJ32754.1 hypothetical protein ASPWEDRAFT_29899 [Aspergillus wentii DTO 134E9]